MICLMCGRVLKSTKSKETGYGPVCYRKVFGSTKQYRTSSSEPDGPDIQYYEIPGQMNIEDYLQSIEK